MKLSRLIVSSLGIALVASLAVGCGGKKSPAVNGSFPSETDLSSTDSTADSLQQNVDGQATALTADQEELARRAAELQRSVTFDPDTLSITEPAGKSLGEAGEAIPELANVFFALDSYELSGSAKENLGRSVTYLKSNPSVYVVLRGHCDDTGTDEYNLALGSQRAQAVRQFLIEQGIGQIRLETLSFGESMPAVEGSDDDSRAKNRRVEFFVYTMTQ